MRLLRLLALAATPAIAGSAHAEPVAVVASFPILADIVGEIGGGRVGVVSLVPPGGDVHVYAPSPQDARRVAEADLVVVNGLGFEGFIDRLVDAAGSDAPVVVAAAHVDPLPAADHDADAGADAHAEHEHEHEPAGEAAHEDHDHGAYDPHAFQDAGNVRLYAKEIAAGLETVDPAGAELYRQNLARFDAELAALDAEIAAELAPFRGETVLIAHDAMNYFGRRYGIDIAGVQGISTDAEPSARDVAALVRRMRDRHVVAIFAEANADRRLVDAIAAETGVAVGQPLYIDTLSPPDGPAPSYLAMMRYNAATLTTALAGAKR